MKAKSLHGNSAQEIQDGIQNATSDGFKPSLAIVFIAKTQDHGAHLKIFNDAGIPVFGVSTNGEYIDENTFTNSCAVMLFDLDPAYFRISFAEFEEGDYRGTSRNIAQKELEHFANPAFLISCSHSHTDAEAVLQGFSDVAGPDVNVFGNVAGDDCTFEGGFVFTNHIKSESALMVLTFDGDHIDMKGRATCGWHAVGTVRTVTKSEGNHVYTVDDIPVLDLTAKYGGLENVNPENEKLFFEIAATLPLQLQREKGDPVMRPGLVIDWNDRSYYCSGSVPQGSKVRFSVPPDFDVAEKVIKSAQDLKDTEIPNADAIVVFSCVGRFLAFGPMINMEIEGIKNVWDVPMVGMFSNAELGRATGGNLEMHNLTAVVIALKEK
ncbi:FIST signal transduction protein [Flavobacterium silvaticum]|uniref:Histidine kinase n=1 Tax=Flavobacterium silvaticum TaxID=1852020 RepID=A0A972FXC6_9FLAO|nr:FIST N-terminal domain-containing protein [Flavobacterium silvaticum]NMH26586.1 hypothetical protein [Flavobacterium silvaticum]